jgi:hypothetical protein
LRVLRTVPRQQLLAAVQDAPQRSDEPAQRVLEQYLGGTLAPVVDLRADELAGLLQVERWLGPGAGLPAPEDVASRLDWLDLLAPLQRLLARGFVGREDVLQDLAHHVEAPSTTRPFVIEGIGGSGKSTVLARLVETVTARGELVCYAGLDRSWLVQGGAWTLLDEITRQVGLQLPAVPSGPQDLTELRRRVQQHGRRTGYQDIASRGTQQVERVPPWLLDELGGLVGGRRLVLVLDTLEELARRDASLAQACSWFLEDLARAVPGLRVVAAGRARPRSGFPTARVVSLTGLSEPDGVRLLHLLTATEADEELLLRIVRTTGGNPLSLHLAADVLRRTGTDPTGLIAIGEGDIQGQLYSRLLEHIKDSRARAIAHPGLVVRRITADVIREVLAEPCGIAPLPAQDAAAVFWALHSEATLCEPSMDGDGALVHRPDVRAIMLPAITRARPAVARAIHAAAVRYYGEVAPQQGTADRVARREELYHRLMLKQPRPELDRRWMPSVADELAAVIDELPAESQLYVTGQVKGLELDPAVRREADDEQWRHSVRPAAESSMERGQVTEALALLRERRGHDGRVLLPELEIEALERLDRVDEALRLAEDEQRRASRSGDDTRVRDLIMHQARILERMGRFEDAHGLLVRLAQLDRAARARGGVLDEEVRVRDLVVLTSLLRNARHAGRAGADVDELRVETVELADSTPARMLARTPSLLRDLAAEVGDLSPRILEQATMVRGADPGPPVGTPGQWWPPTEPAPVSREQFISETDESQKFL